MTPTLIFERAVHRDPDTGQLVSYWPDMWSIQTLALECIAQGSAYFAASYMNDPSGLEGNKLKVAWLKPYTPSELDAARLTANIHRGVRYVGVDPTHGGEGVDADYTALFSAEMIDNRGYALDFLNTHVTVEKQPQLIEDWLDLQQPDFVTLEETAAKGFVGTAMLTQVNDGKGSKWPIHIEKPQGANTPQGKDRRIMSIAPRWENGQILIPGMIINGQLVIDPRWDMFVQQWRTYPVGHDDLLDAQFWTFFNAFSEVLAGGTMKGPEGYTAEQLRVIREEGRQIKAATDDKGRTLRPIGVHKARKSVRINRGGRGGGDYDDRFQR